MTETMGWCLLVLSALQAVTIVGLVLLRRRRSEAPEVGRELTVGDVEALAMEHADDPVVVSLAMDWQRLHRQRQKDVAMLTLELTDALSKAPPGGARAPTLGGAS